MKTRSLRGFLLVAVVLGVLAAGAIHVGDRYAVGSALSSHADLTVDATDIWISPQRPLTGDVVALKAVVRNLGDVHATDVSVAFRDNAAGATTETYLIGTDAVDVPPGGTAVAEVMWDTAGESAENLITVNADSLQGISEGDEENNQATAEIFVSELTGDVNCIGGINPVDALAILQWDAGLEYSTRFPCPLIGE
jgi:hypothetical protein